jgi:hypothetical protein
MSDVDSFRGAPRERVFAELSEALAMTLSAA